MDSKNIILAVVAVIAVIALAVGLNKPAPAQPVGAVSSPDFLSQWFSVGGLREWRYSASPKAANYTLCSFQSPAATSTIKSAGISLTTSTTSASTLYIAKAATATATTTLLGTAFSVAAGAQATVIASTTPWEAGSAAIIAPSQYVNFAINPEASVITNLAPVGTCHVVFEEYLPI